MCETEICAERMADSERPLSANPDVDGPRILTLQFWPGCHLGQIHKTFSERGVTNTNVRVDHAGGCARSLFDAHDGLVLLGGPQYAEDDENHPYLASAVDLVRRFHESAKPVLGVCLGGQLLARALGARVHKQGWTEIGFIEIEPTPAANDDPLFEDQGSVRIMQFHEDTFDLPADSELLMTGTSCRNQVFRVGRSYGFQCHFECSITLWNEWYAELHDHLFQADPTYHANWKNDFERHEAGSLEFCANISARWLDLVDAARHSVPG